MSDKIQGGILAGATGVSLTFALRKASDSTEQTGKVAADMTLSYLRQGGTRTSITASDLGSVNASHSDGGVKEIDATNMPGLYRLDIPDAAIATGADWVHISVKVAGCFVYHERIPLTTNIIQTGDAYARLGAPAGASAAADIAAIKAVLPTALGANGNIKADVRDFNGAAGTFASGRPEVNTTHAAGTAWGSGAITASAIAADAITAAKVAADVSQEIRNEIDTNSTGLAAIKAKTDNLPSDPADASDLATAIGGVLSAISALNDLDAAEIRTALGLASANLDTQLAACKGTTAITESYAANGVAPTRDQALMAIHQYLMQFAISGTSYTVKKLNNTDPAFVVGLDSATTPTSAART